MNSEQIKEYESVYYVYDPKTNKTEKYPSIRETRIENSKKDLDAKAELTKKMYTSISGKLKYLTPRTRSLLINEVNGLRLPLASVKKKYLDRGEPKENIDMIVNYKTYPFLPDVKVTKKQQEVLLELCNGITKGHTEFINNGYK